MKVQLVIPYRVSHLQRYGITVRGNVTSVYPPQPLFLKGMDNANDKCQKTTLWESIKMCQKHKKTANNEIHFVHRPTEITNK